MSARVRGYSQQVGAVPVHRMPVAGRAEREVAERQRQDAEGERGESHNPAGPLGRPESRARHARLQHPACLPVTPTTAGGQLFGRAERPFAHPNFALSLRCACQRRGPRAAACPRGSPPFVCRRCCSRALRTRRPPSHQERARGAPPPPTRARILRGAGVLEKPGRSVRRKFEFLLHSDGISL